jgi:PleD family two-component response regulator
MHDALASIDIKHAVEVSIGVATLRDELTAEDLLRTADVGLTNAKQQGGAQVSRVNSRVS